MPRTTRTSQASGSGEERLVLSGDEDAVAPSPRLSKAEKQRLRGIEQNLTLGMYDHAVAYLKRDHLHCECGCFHLLK